MMDYQRQTTKTILVENTDDYMIIEAHQEGSSEGYGGVQN